MNKVTIFTDGASRGNPGPGGWAAIVVDGEEVTELGGGESETTNNRMELTAAIEALAFLEMKNQDTEAITNSITIYTDSSYVLKGAKSWLKGWEKGNWQTKAKEDVLNKDLWQRLSKVMEGKDIEWHLVKGHVGIAGNDQADKIATAFADGKNLKPYSGLLKEYPIDILNISHNTELTEKRSSSKSRSRAAAFSYVSKVGGKIEVHKTWAECEKRVKGTSAALFKKALTPEEEKEIIEDFSKR